MNALDYAIDMAVIEIFAYVDAAVDAAGGEAGVAEYRRFATTLAKSPFSLLRVQQQQEITAALLDPERIDDANTLYEIATNVRLMVEANTDGGWAEVLNGMRNAVFGIINSEVIPVDVRERMSEAFIENQPMITMAILYFAMRKYNAIKVSEDKNREANSERSR